MKSQKYIGAILFLVSIIAVLFDKAFLLNPFVLIVLYFSFYYGLSNYLVNSLAMIVVAFIISKIMRLKLRLLSLLIYFPLVYFLYYLKNQVLSIIHLLL